MRFSIRDLLWATLVVAMALGWWVSYRALDAKRLEAVGQARKLRTVLVEAKRWHDGPRVKDSELSYAPWARWRINWSVLDEPLVEP